MSKLIANIVVWGFTLSFLAAWAYVAFKTLKHLTGACQ